MPPYVIMRPTMSGRPLLSCVASHSTVMVKRSACAVSAHSPRQPARRSAPPSLLATGALVTGRDGDAIGGAGGTNGLLEVHVVVRADGAGNEAHALCGYLALRVERLHEEPRDAVARFPALGDDAPYDERPPHAVLRRLPFERDRARVADLGRGARSLGSGGILGRCGRRLQQERAGQ